jgi:RNA recognition motif-containing protein
MLYSFARLKVPNPTETHPRSSPLSAPSNSPRIGAHQVKNIFVGNLDFNTDEEQLRQLFGRYGNVDRVAVMTDRDTGRSRGFAFVEMTNTDEGEKAISDLNGTQLDGRTINVNEARPKAERSGGRDRGFQKSGSRRSGRW